jgi:hypothetical protein
MVPLITSLNLSSYSLYLFQSEVRQALFIPFFQGPVAFIEMAPTKLKSIPIDWLQRNLFAPLPEAMIGSSETLRSVQDYITKLEGTPLL